ncbi:hypothetical protein NUACC21_29940 [Scytonema sp. NUACC21]
MLSDVINKLGDWNPQFLRELKGRLKVFPAVLAVATSLLVQLVVFLYQLRELPGDKYLVYDKYCKLGLTYEELRIKFEKELTEQYQQLQELFRRYSSVSEYDAVKLKEVKSQISQVQYKQNNIHERISNQLCPIDQIDMQMWWQDHWQYIFFTMSVIFIFTLLVAGTYLLINNLATEERHGTLNFIRLSPLQEKSFFIGKMLGVPILIYLVVLAAVPFHWLAGFASRIATSHILGFWAVLIACCIFFYSAALLFGLCCRWSSGFQPWLGSGAVLLFLLITVGLAGSSGSYLVETAWLRMFSPFDITDYLFPNNLSEYNGQPLKRLQFFNWQVGKSAFAVVTLHLFNYGLWTYWLWQALARCFRNPNNTILSKSQSYFVIGCWQIFNLGFYIRGTETFGSYSINFIQSYVAWIYPLTLLVFLGLIAIVSPHRQTVQDWARYRHQNVSSSSSFRKSSLWEDLIRGEKSPALVAIAINLIITATPFIVWILLWDCDQINLSERIKGILAVGLFASLIMIYATIAQLLLLMKTSKRSLWAIGTIAAAAFLPPMILGIVNISTSQTHIFWLLTSFSWVGIAEASISTISTVLLVQFSILVLLMFKLNREVKLAGESATQALLAGR